MFPLLKRRGARPVLAAVFLAAVLLAFDGSRPPERQLAARAVVTAIHAYQSVGAPALARLGVRCRFEPTCSVYAEAALRRHGMIAGGWLTVKRLARCGPWTPAGTRDEVP